MRIVAVILPAVASVLLAVPASAGAHEVCFDPRSDRLAPSGYAALRDVIGEARAQPGGLAIITVLASADSQLARDRLFAIELELERLGLTSHQLETQSPEREATDCHVVRIEPGSRPVFRETFSMIFFRPASATLEVAGRRMLQRMAASYIPGVAVFVVEGHADAVGDPAANERLSARRAGNVALGLIRLGVREADIVLESYGEQRLAKPSTHAEPLNRRVVVTIRANSTATPR